VLRSEGRLAGNGGQEQGEGQESPATRHTRGLRRASKRPCRSLDERPVTPGGMTVVEAD
jgi:hypothetical protein